MPDVTRRANARKSAVRSKVEHVFAEQKSRMGVVAIRSVRVRLQTLTLEATHVTDGSLA
jgi:hypothetical protein